MRTMCEFIIELFRPRTTKRAILSEEEAIQALYFTDAAGGVDPGLVERLLWWEGVAPPTSGGMQRIRAERAVA